ncbi:MAG: hypothetical protein ACP5T4_02710 [Candidatus Micrarchaeia archaeon]
MQLLHKGESEESREKKLFDLLWAGDAEGFVRLAEEYRQKGVRINWNAIDYRNKICANIPARNLLEVSLANPKLISASKYLLGLKDAKGEAVVRVTKVMADEVAKIGNEEGVKLLAEYGAQFSDEALVNLSEQLKEALRVLRPPQVKPTKQGFVDKLKHMF